MKKYITSSIIFLLITGFYACVKEKHTAPPNTNTDPNIAVNFSIDSVVARCVKDSNQNYLFTQDLVISAIVTADDRSGNFYKEVVIQDSTAGITLLLNGYDLYTNYPIGRRLFINLKGLWVVDYDGTYELANYVDSLGNAGGIPPTLYGKYVTPGKWGVTVSPIDVPISTLNTNLLRDQINIYQNELVELDAVQFNRLSPGATYANDSSLASSNLTLSDCTDSLSVYTSGYADFAGSVVPSGRGKLLGIFSIYNGSGQITLRDTTDVFLTGQRCP